MPLFNSNFKKKLFIIDHFSLEIILRKNIEQKLDLKLDLN